VAVLSARFIGVPRVSMDPLEYYYNWTATAGGEVHRCVGGRVAWVSVISNILLQEHLWEFDLMDRLLRFKHTRCVR
jgi:hypothetical protein